MYQEMCLILLQILTTTIAGALIDQNLKYLRWFLLVPAIGELIVDILNSLSITYFNWSPITILVYSLLLNGFAGSSLGAMLIAITYVSRESTKERRSTKIGYTILSRAIGTGLGSAISGYVIDYLGFGNGFLLSVGMTSFSLLLGSRHF